MCIGQEHSADLNIRRRNTTNTHCQSTMLKYKIYLMIIISLTADIDFCTTLYSYLTF